MEQLIEETTRTVTAALMETGVPADEARELAAWAVQDIVSGEAERRAAEMRRDMRDILRGMQAWR